MKLLDYVGGFFSPKSSAQQQSPGFPDSLEVPDKLIDDWHYIYTVGERMGCEWGESLTLQDTGSLKIKRSDTVKGNADSCEVPRDPTNQLEFGDMHCHPSLSIGHVNGYSPHSVEDWRVFRHHLTRPVFIRFVASGDYIYAVVYRNGVSQYDKVRIDLTLAKHSEKLEEYSKRFHLKEEAGDPDVVVDRDPIQEQLELLAKKRKAPGFGEKLMKLAGRNNVELAKHLKFGFYMGKKKGLLKLTHKWD